MSTLTDLVDAAIADDGRPALEQHLREQDDRVSEAIHYALPLAEKASRGGLKGIESAVSPGAWSTTQSLIGQYRLTGRINPYAALALFTVWSSVAPEVLVALLDILAAAEKTPVQ